MAEALMVTVDEKHFIGQGLEPDDLVALYLRVIPRVAKIPRNDEEVALAALAPTLKPL